MRHTIRLYAYLVIALCLGLIWSTAGSGTKKTSYPFTLPELGYGYDALEPHIDARTLEIHYSKHHASYVKKLNDALKDHPYLHHYSLEELLGNIQAIPETIRIAVKENAGGSLHHTLFWEVMKPGGKKEAYGAVLEGIERDFGSMAVFKEKFNKAAASRVGSGWTWLAADRFGKLHVFSTKDHESPVSEGFIPIIVLDVWEHAYYLKYQNRRNEFTEAFWKVINWDVVNKKYETAQDFLTKE